MTLDEILALHPEHQEMILETLAAAGLHCIGCLGNQSLSQGLKAHGIEEKEIEALYSQLNHIVLQKVAKPTISLTEKAAKKFLEIANEEGKPNSPLRFGILQMGCHGFDYILDFSDGQLEDDVLFESNGIKIHVEKAMVPALIGTEIDYVDDEESGFKISNPNLKRSCCGGCGGSCH